MPRKYLITQARQNFDDFLDAIDSKVGPEGYTLLTGSAGMIKLNGVGRRLLPREPIEDKRYDRLQNGFEETYVLNPAGTSTMSMLQYPDSGAIEIMYLSTLVGLPQLVSSALGVLIALPPIPSPPRARRPRPAAPPRSGRRHRSPDYRHRSRRRRSVHTRSVADTGPGMPGSVTTCFRTANSRSSRSRAPFRTG